MENHAENFITADRVLNIIVWQRNCRIPMNESKIRHNEFDFRKNRAGGFLLTFY